MSNSLRHKTLANVPTHAGTIGGTEWDQEHLFAGGQSEGDLVCWDPTASDKVRVGYNAVDVINSQNNLISNKIVPTATGSNQQLGLYLKMVGSTVLTAGKFRIPLALRAETGGAGVGNAEGMDAMNIVVQQNSADSPCYLNGIELSFNNNKRNDALDPGDVNHFGMTIDVYGGFSTGPAALAIRQGNASSSWQRGLWIPANAITPSTGFAIAYDGDSGGKTFKVAANAQVQVGHSLVLSGTGVQPSAGPGMYNNGGVAFTFMCGSSDFRWFSNNAGAELMRLTNAGELSIGSSQSTSTFVLTPAGTTARSSIRLPHGSAPTSPVNGDMWTTSSGLFVRINGVTVGPLT